MATPFDQIGGLLGMDPEQLKALMAQFSPSEDDRKAAKMTGITQLGLGLLGARKGREWDQAGYAGQNALAARDASLQGSQAAKMQQFQMAEHFAKLNAGQQEAQRKAALNQKIGSLFNANPTQGMADRSPTVENAANVPARKANWEIYLQASQEAALGGDMPAAKHWADLAEKHKPKYSTSPQTVRGKDGKLQLAQFSDDGSNKVADGLMPAEKLHFGSTGGMTNVGFDQYSGAPVSQGLPATMDPAQENSAKLGWANFGLARNADARAAASSAGGPKAPEGYRWAADGKALEFIPGGPKDPANGGGKELTESQGTASMYLGMMKSASADIAKFGEKLPLAEAALARGDVRFVPTAIQNWAASDEGQKYAQSGMQWTEAMLRITTGATAPDPELLRMSRMFFPQLGDKPEIIKQKNAKRAQMEKFVAIKAGAGSGKVDAAMNDGWTMTEVKP